MQDKVCRERLKDLYHEGRIQCIITYNTDVLGRVVRKREARQMMLQRETVDTGPTGYPTKEREDLV